MKFQPLTKAASYWSSLFSILSVYFVTAAIDKEGARAIAGAVITAIVALSGLSQGLNVANNVQRSALYKPELDKEIKPNAKARSR